MASPTVVYAVQPARERSRLTVFFRALLWLPHYVTVLIYGIGAGFAVLAAWFAIVFTGRYPDGLYRFVVRVLQYMARQTAYLYLQVDAYPSFALGEQEGYPANLIVGPAPESYSRAKTAFRLILAIPVMIINYAMGAVASVMAVIVWFASVILGRTGEGLHDALHLGISYQVRAMAYFTLVTEDWPSITQDASTAGTTT